MKFIIHSETCEWRTVAVYYSLVREHNESGSEIRMVDDNVKQITATLTSLISKRPNSKFHVIDNHR